MSEEAFEVSGRNEYRYLVQDEEEEVQYARHRQYISPLVVLSRRCIALIVVGVLALLFLATYLGYVAKTLPPGAAQVSTPCGTYKGLHKHGAYSFKGLRYAAPPVGPLRWAPPVAAECKSDSVHDATRFGSVCAQVRPLSSSGSVLGHEDCLFLNVWTPSLAPPAPLPVLVWIHGGYLHMLSGGEAGYSPSERLAAETGLVYVSLNYRLNAFGFMALETLRDGKTNSSGNYGFMDQILALQWVQKNIHLFGGDASQVTIMGQSSGGTSVWTLMTSPLAKGLFRAAVDMSGSFVYKATLPEAERDNLVFLNRTGCEDAPCLRRLSVRQVLQAVPWQEYPFWAYDDGTELPTRGLLPGAVAVVDGHVLPDAPLSLWARGGRGYSDVPFVIGTTEQEVDFYPPSPNISLWTWGDYRWFVTQKLSTFNESLPRLALEQYSPSAPCPTRDRCPERAYTTMTSDIRVTCPNHELARRATAALNSPVYRYVLTHTPSRAISPSPPLLLFPSRFSFHTLDSVAFFRGLEPLLGSPLLQDDQRFQDLITHHLVYFIKQGKMEASWSEFPSVALISDNFTVVASDDPVVTRCKLWDENGFLEYAWIN